MNTTLHNGEHINESVAYVVMWYEEMSNNGGFVDLFFTLDEAKNCVLAQNDDYIYDIIKVTQNLDGTKKSCYIKT